MFWIVLVLIIIVALIIDEIGIIDKQAEVTNDVLTTSDYFYFHKKEILLSSIQNIELAVSSWFWYPKQVIQISSEGRRIVLSRITLLNYKHNSMIVKQIKDENPSVVLNSELNAYLISHSVGDYFVNAKQIKRGILVILFLFGLFVLAYLEQIISKIF
jgi:hypothetical protein